MSLHTIAFASSLFLIALFFSIKEREAYVGRSTALTRFFVHHSPAAERLWRSCVTWIVHICRTVFDRVAAIAKNLAARIVVTFRYIVAILADKMIKAVRGEKFLERTGAPSMYLKHLKEHRDVKNCSRDESVS